MRWCGHVPQGSPPVRLPPPHSRALTRVKAKPPSLASTPKPGCSALPSIRWLGFLGFAALAFGVTYARGEIPIMSHAEVAAEYQVHTWTSQDGLPSGVILGLYQTRDGSIWIACQGGLARFNGSRFTVYDRINTPVLSGEPVCLTEDESNELWIGSFHSGLVRKRGNDFVRSPVFPDADSGVPLFDLDIRSLYARQGGGVWAGAGLLLPLQAEARGPHYENFIAQAAGPLAAGYDDQKNLWVSFRTNLTRITPDGERFTSVAVPPGYEGKTVWGIGRSGSGGVWLGFVDLGSQELTPRGATYLAHYKAGKWDRAPTKPDAWVAWGTLGITEDRTGAVWMPYQQNTLLRFRDDRFVLVPFGPNAINEIPSTAMVDRDGVLWVGSRENILRRYTPRRIRVYTTNDGLAHDDVWSVSEASDGSILAGTEGGVSRLYPDGKLGSLPLPPKQAKSNVRAIVQESNGTIWFGTIRALHRWDGSGMNTVNFPGEWVQSKVRALCPARDGGLWVGTVRGLLLYRDGKVAQHANGESVGGEEVRAIHESQDGALWVGTHGGGLSRIHQGRRETFTADNGLSGATACSIYEDKDRTIWAATDNGLTRIRNSSVRAFREADGLLATTIHCVLEDNFGRLWMSSDKGVFWAWKSELNELRDGDRVRCITYEVVDGLPGRVCNGQTSHPSGCKSRDGRLWFPTPGGLVVIDPKLVGAEENPPSSVIEQVRANGKLIAGTTPDDVAQAIGTKLGKINPGTNAPRLAVPGVFQKFPPGSARVIEFRYGANSFTAPEKTVFRYRLVGLDDSWIDAGSRREAYFTDLRPGPYRFELLAGNHHGAWQSRPATVDFELLPFFYQTWWFYGLVGACGVLLVGGVAVWHTRELKHHHELQRLKALSEQRRRIARDIHDELGASLSYIVQLTDTRRAVNRVAEAAEDRSRRIATVASEAVNHINEIVWANNPEYDTLQDLIAYIREYAASYLDPTGIEVRFAFPDQVPSRNVSGLFRRGVLLIVKEILHNAVKHARTKTLRFELKLDATQLQICISDDGCGFRLEEGRRVGNGLGSMLYRAEELRGTLKIRSAPSQGTSIHLEVPFS